MIIVIDVLNFHNIFIHCKGVYKTYVAGGWMDSHRRPRTKVQPP